MPVRTQITLFKVVAVAETVTSTTTTDTTANTTTTAPSVSSPARTALDTLRDAGATLLADGPVELENFPRIRDVETMVELLADIGADTEWTGPNEVRVDVRWVRGEPLRTLDHVAPADVGLQLGHGARRPVARRRERAPVEVVLHELGAGLAPDADTVAGGTPLPEPTPLFQKFDDSVAAEEEARLGQ